MCSTVCMWNGFPSPSIEDYHAMRASITTPSTVPLLVLHYHWWIAKISTAANYQNHVYDSAPWFLRKRWFSPFKIHFHLLYLYLYNDCNPEFSIHLLVLEGPEPFYYVCLSVCPFVRHACGKENLRWTERCRWSDICRARRCRKNERSTWWELNCAKSIKRSDWSTCPACLNYSS